MCCQKVRSVSGWVNESNSNSSSYLQVHPSFNSTLFAISCKQKKQQTNKYINIVEKFEVLIFFPQIQPISELKLYHKFIHFFSISITAILHQVKPSQSFELASYFIFLLQCLPFFILFSTHQLPA